MTVDVQVVADFSPQDGGQTLPLFDDVGPRLPDLRALSPDRRRTLRQAQRLELGVHPLTGGTLHAQAPRDATRWDRIRGRAFTCGGCAHRVTQVEGEAMMRVHPKCEITSLSHSAASDCWAWWPACSAYVPRNPI